MSEVAFTTQAHVFRIEPGSGASWTPVAAAAVPISFVHDRTAFTARIVATSGSTGVVDCLLDEEVAFAKSSQKFGQWEDPATGVLYGVGFASELDLAKFAEHFSESLAFAAAMAKNAEAAEERLAAEEERQQQAEEEARKASSQADMAAVEELKRKLRAKEQQVDGLLERVGSLERDAASAQMSQTDNVASAREEVQRLRDEMRLVKEENGRLRNAVSQSTANVADWEQQIQTLRQNNSRLLTALQESSANVESWKLQLNLYEEQNTTLGKKLQSLEILQQKFATVLRE